MFRLLVALLVLSATCPAVSRAASAVAGPGWNGTWTLDRSRPEPEGAADDYRFTVTPDGSIRWEIPSLHEDNLGRLDGTPMPIRRSGVAAGLTLSSTFRIFKIGRRFYR